MEFTQCLSGSIYFTLNDIEQIIKLSHCRPHSYFELLLIQQFFQVAQLTQEYISYLNGAAPDPSGDECKEKPNPQPNPARM